VDGSAFGNITGVTVSKDGTVTAEFSNGLTQNVYKIPLATFADPDGLGQVSGNAYTATKASGAANISLASIGSAGSIQAESLEGSTVDLATEFTNLITTQRAYSASARIITTADQMLQQLEQLPTN
jgi:flagellar hook protein FlgE